LALSNNQISGFIFITANENSGLRDRSHREGLIDTVEYEDLKELTLKIVNELEIRRKTSRQKPRDPRGESGGKSGLFDDFKLENLQGLAQGRPEDTALNEIINETLQDVEAGAARIQEVLMQFSRLATLGTLVDLVLHEGRSALMHVRTSAENVGFNLEDSTMLEEAILSSARNNLAKLDVGVETLSSMFNRLGPMSGRRRGRPKPISLKLLIDQGLELQRAELNRLKIDLRVDVSDEVVTVDPSEIYQILINLVGNSAYWVTQIDSIKRKIVVYGHRDKQDNIVIGVNDNGPGIPEDERERVFDEYFTRRIDGTGLGLSIVRTLVHDFYDGSAVIEEGGELPGANVKVTLRRRIK
jgi:C4-dicarboxylate-specific signal transduction histidine kinase